MKILGFNIGWSSSPSPSAVAEIMSGSPTPTEVAREVASEMASLTPSQEAIKEVVVTFLSAPPPSPTPLSVTASVLPTASLEAIQDLAASALTTPIDAMTCTLENGCYVWNPDTSVIMGNLSINSDISFAFNNTVTNGTASIASNITAAANTTLNETAGKVAEVVIANGTSIIKTAATYITPEFYCDLLQAGLSSVIGEHNARVIGTVGHLAAIALFAGGCFYLGRQAKDKMDELDTKKSTGFGLGAAACAGAALRQICVLAPRLYT